LINELESLGISSEKIYDYLNDSINEELNSITELTDLVENIQQTIYQEYKTPIVKERVTCKKENKE
jgi:hypothetical protein